MFNRFFAIIFFSLILNPICFAEWVKVSESDAAFHFVDSKSVMKAGNILKLWELQDLKKNKPKQVQASLFRQILQVYGNLLKKVLLFWKQKEIYSFRYATEYDCKNWLTRIISFTAHSGPMASGKIIKEEIYDYEGWTSIAPNTPTMRVFKIVCKK